MKKKQFDITNIISDDSDSEILNKYSFNYKKLEQTKDNTINCFLRIKPLDQKEKEKNQHTLFKIQDVEKKILCASKDNFRSNSKYIFARIFDENSIQEEVFSSICLPALQDIFSQNKKSALVFAYGMTNSGKTHTVIGSNENPGLINLSLKYALDKISGKAAGGESANTLDDKLQKADEDQVSNCENNNIKEEKNSQQNIANDNLKVYATFCEIYNEELFDLFFIENNTNSNNVNVNNLSKSSTNFNNLFGYSENRIPLLSNMKQANNEAFINGKKRVFLKEKDKYFCIPDLTEREITSLEEFSEFFESAASKKVHASTNLNTNSSRSHSIFKLIFRFKKPTNKLSLINNNNITNNLININNNNINNSKSNLSYTNNNHNNINNLNVSAAATLSKNHPYQHQQTNNLISNNHILSKAKSKENLFTNNNLNNFNYINTNNNANNAIQNLNLYEEYTLTIVDLAGSERTARSEVSGKNFSETCKINSSLTTLSRCFQIMKKNVNFISKQMIPYRESNLTKIFQENFLLDHSISMITTINPTLTDFDDTLRILDFAGLTGKIITQKSRGILFDSNVKNRNNNLYLPNGRLNPEFNTNPAATKQFNVSNLFNNTLSDFNENEPAEKVGRNNNVCNISVNNDEVFKASAAKVFSSNLHNIALKSSYKENIIPEENVAEKDKVIQEIKAQMEKEKQEAENLRKEMDEMKKNAEKEKVFQYIEQGEKVAEVAEHVEKYYIKVVKDLKEKINELRQRTETKAKPEDKYNQNSNSNINKTANETNNMNNNINDNNTKNRQKRFILKNPFYKPPQAQQQINANIVVQTEAFPHQTDENSFTGAASVIPASIQINCSISNIAPAVDNNHNLNNNLNNEFISSVNNNNIGKSNFDDLVDNKANEYNDNKNDSNFKKDFNDFNKNNFNDNYNFNSKSNFNYKFASKNNLNNAYFDKTETNKLADYNNDNNNIFDAFSRSAMPKKNNFNNNFIQNNSEQMNVQANLEIKENHQTSSQNQSMKKNTLNFKEDLNTNAYNAEINHKNIFNNNNNNHINHNLHSAKKEINFTDTNKKINKNNNINPIQNQDFSNGITKSNLKLTENQSKKQDFMDICDNKPLEGEEKAKVPKADAMDICAIGNNNQNNFISASKNFVNNFEEINNNENNNIIAIGNEDDYIIPLDNKNSQSPKNSIKEAIEILTNSQIKKKDNASKLQSIPENIKRFEINMSGINNVSNENNENSNNDNNINNPTNNKQLEFEIGFNDKAYVGDVEKIEAKNVSSKIDSQIKTNKVFANEDQEFNNYNAGEVLKSADNANNIVQKDANEEEAVAFVNKNSKNAKKKNNKKQTKNLKNNFENIEVEEEEKYFNKKQKIKELEKEAKDKKIEEVTDNNINIIVNANNKNKKNTKKAKTKAKEKFESDEDLENNDNYKTNRQIESEKINEKKASIASEESEKPKKDKKTKAKKKKSTKSIAKVVEYDSSSTEEKPEVKSKRDNAPIYSDDEDKSDQDASSEEQIRNKKSKTTKNNKTKTKNTKNKKATTKKNATNKSKIIEESEEEKEESENEENSVAPYKATRSKAAVAAANKKANNNNKNKKNKKIIEEVSDNSDEEREVINNDSESEDVKKHIETDEESLVEEKKTWRKNAQNKKKNTKKTKK